MVTLTLKFWDTKIPKQVTRGDEVFSAVDILKESLSRYGCTKIASIPKKPLQLLLQFSLLNLVTFDNTVLPMIESQFQVHVLAYTVKRMDVNKKQNWKAYIDLVAKGPDDSDSEH